MLVNPPPFLLYSHPVILTGVRVLIPERVIVFEVNCVEVATSVISENTNGSGSLSGGTGGPLDSGGFTLYG
jgi:hypothetical protein